MKMELKSKKKYLNTFMNKNYKLILVVQNNNLENIWILILPLKNSEQHLSNFVKNVFNKYIVVILNIIYIYHYVIIWIVKMIFTKNTIFVFENN